MQSSPRSSSPMAITAAALLAACSSSIGSVHDGGDESVVPVDASSAVCGALGHPCCTTVSCDMGLLCLSDTCVAVPIDASDTPDATPTGPAMPCPGDPPCTDPPCAPVLLGGGSVSGGEAWLAVGGNEVWSVSSGGGVGFDAGAIGFVDRCGDGGTLVASSQPAPYYVTADSNGGCWTNLGNTIDGTYQVDGAVWCWDAATGRHQLASDVDEPSGIAVFGSTVYWADGLGMESSGRRGGPVADAMIDGTLESPIAVDASGAYTRGADMFGTTVLAVDPVTGSSTVLADGDWDLRSIVVDDTNVYFNDVDAPHYSTPGQILSVPKTGGAVTTLATADNVGNQIATDGVFVYFIAGPTIERVPIAGGAAQVVAMSIDQYALATDGVYVYLGSVSRVRLPSP